MKDMRIVRGFTLTELLFVMGIIGILATMLAPEFSIMQDRVKFHEDAQKFLDILGEARSNALSNKNCGNTQASMKWTVIFKKHGNGFNIYCQGADGKAAIQANESNFTLASITSIYRVEGADGATWENDGHDQNESDYLGVSYFSGTGQAKIESFRSHDTFKDIAKALFDSKGTSWESTKWATDLNGIRRSTFRLVFNWARKTEKITVCMNAIAGFPRLYNGDIGGTQNCPPE